MEKVIQELRDTLLHTYNVMISYEDLFILFNLLKKYNQLDIIWERKS